MSRETGPERRKAGPAAPVEASDTAEAAAPVRAAFAPREDPRLPVWIRRAAMAAVGGIAVTIWQNWRVGLSVAAAIAIADTIYQSKAMSVIPAAARATSARRSTRRRLFFLRQAGYVALHARAIPGSGEVIDHLVIGPAGVFAVDSERWDRRLPVRTGTGGLLYHGPVSQKDRLLHARWEAAQASALLSAGLQQQLPVRPVMVIYGPTVPWGVANLRGVDVFGGGRVGKYFRRQSRASRRHKLSGDQVATIAEAARQVLPPAG